MRLSLVLYQEHLLLMKKSIRQAQVLLVKLLSLILQILILYYYQTRFLDVGTDSNGNLTAFSGANAITGQSSSASATTEYK